ncbi:MAG: methionyl-tRNA formyltransferase [Litorivicinaceae bacterium]|nr:MAG: methionyl-tRNA formyltransferase [Litorivicinaceae bacterium]
MLRVLFAGTPDFAVATLEALIQDPEISVEYVLTQPDRPGGRGKKMSASAVKRVAIAHGLEVRQPETLKDPEAVQWIQRQHFDALVVVAYGQILRSEVLESPRLGCLNVHASLLPRWRGAAPLQRAIEAGDTETGVTIMLMDEGLDTGPTLATASVQINESTTTAKLHDELAILGGLLLVNTLKKLNEGSVKPCYQTDDGATYAHKISSEAACINWNQDRQTVMRQIHAFNPVPGAYTYANSIRMKVFCVCKAAGGHEQPGTLWKQDNQILVSTQTGNLQILECQLPGGKRLSAAQMISHQSAPWNQAIALAGLTA